jgi:hypothetical protein
VSRDLKAFLKIKTMLQLAQFGYNDWNFLYWRQSWLDLNRIASSLVPYCAAHGTFRYFEICSICFREGLGRSKPATKPWNKHNNTAVGISTISKPYWTVFYWIKWALQVWVS